jgi:osmotically-inducible protein OsmY
MDFHYKVVLIATTSALALGLAACNKPALQTGSKSPPVTAAAPAAGAPIDRPAAGAAIAADPLKEKVTAALNAEPGLAAINVEVNPADGTVTLTGTANNEENKTKASQIALNVPGVMSVQNHLVVKDMT